MAVLFVCGMIGVAVAGTLAGLIYLVVLTVEARNREGIL
jgi:hypothetical protein